ALAIRSGWCGVPGDQRVAKPHGSIKAVVNAAAGVHAAVVGDGAAGDGRAAPVRRENTPAPRIAIRAIERSIPGDGAVEQASRRIIEEKDATTVEGWAVAGNRAANDGEAGRVGSGDRPAALTGHARAVRVTACNGAVADDQTAALEADAAATVGSVA